MTEDEFHAKKGWIGVDFDGTLATYHGFQGDDVTGDPIEPMVRLVRKYIHEGYDVRLFTARKPHPALRTWMQKHLGRVLKITNVKDPGLIAFFDDKAINVKKNTGELFGEQNVFT